CRSRCAVGSAMFTIVASSTTISWASPMTARIHQRRGSGASLAGGVGGFAAVMTPANLMETLWSQSINVANQRASRGLPVNQMPSGSVQFSEGTSAHGRGAGVGGEPAARPFQLVTETQMLPPDA